MATQVFYARPEESGRNYSASGTIAGGSLVEFTADKAVGAAGAASLVVAGWCPVDAVLGDLVPVYREGVVPCVASGAVAFGQRVVAAAAGAVAAAGATPDARTTVGYAEAAIANGATGPIVLSI